MDRAIRDLVIANRILAREDVVDAYGHVSVRHPTKPDHYLLSRSLSPEHVTKDDIIEFTLDGTPVGDTRPPYLERFIHGAVYEARPEVRAVVHSHAEDTLPFSISRTTPLCCVAHVASDMGTKVPVWDIADKFGDATNLLVINMAQGRDMARKLEDNTVVLMRGHGFSAAADSLLKVVRLCVYLPRNARNPAARDAARRVHAHVGGRDQFAARLQVGGAGHAARVGVLGEAGRLCRYARFRSRRGLSVSQFIQCF